MGNSANCTYFKNATRSCKLSIWVINKQYHVAKILFSLLQESKKNIERTFFPLSSGQKTRQRKKSVTFQLPSDNKHVLALDFLSWIMVRLVKGSCVNFSQQYYKAGGGRDGFLRTCTLLMGNWPVILKWLSIYTLEKPYFVIEGKTNMQYN